MNGFADINDIGYVVGQTIKIFVPAIGMTEGVIQTLSGDPKGPAKIFIPGIGVVEGVAGAAGGTWSMVSGGMDGIGGELTQNLAESFGPWIIGGVAIVVIALLLKK